jgi:2-haloacid dehalogenase
MMRVCVFDVNETLLDLSALDPLFEHVFGDAAVRRTWFTQVLKTAFVSTLVGDYHDFGAVGSAALDMTAVNAGVKLSSGDRQNILESMTNLPAYADVRPALERLKIAGVRMAALTNSTERVAYQQLGNAGIADYFEQILSADMARRLKPAPEPYHMAATRLGVGIDQLCMIAAHDWDVAGAMGAGAMAAFVARPGMVVNPLFKESTVVGLDMREVVEKLLTISTATTAT